MVTTFILEAAVIDVPITADSKFLFYFPVIIVVIVLVNYTYWLLHNTNNIIWFISFIFIVYYLIFCTYLILFMV